MAYCGSTYYKSAAEWKPASEGCAPPNAIEVGNDGSDLVYVARAHHEESNIPGKLVPARGFCYISVDGEEHKYVEYEVLVAPSDSTQWKHACGPRLPPGALQGGNAHDGEPLYIGRVSHEGAMCSGRIQPSHSALYIPHGGGEHKHENYEVLCLKNASFNSR